MAKRPLLNCARRRLDASAGQRADGADERLEALVATLAQGVVMADRDGRLAMVNDRAATLLGLEPGRAAPGEPLARLFPPPVGEAGEARDAAASPYDLIRPDGRVLEIRSEPMPDGGLLRLVTDVTDHRRVEREMRAARDAAEAGARARSEFLAVMSHEIRTPLNAIIGLSGLLQDATLPPEQVAHARLIREAGDHLLALINDILDFSALEAGRLTLEATVFDPRAEAAAAIARLEPQARGKGLSMRSEIATEVPRYVVGDPGRLRQVLLNLLNNAVKFTDAGVVTLTMHGLPAEPGQVRLGVAVRDSGIGIPPAAMSRLFAAFQQGDASNSRRFGGTGLGLAISRQLVERMGGSIAVESKPGQGSTFRFDILLRAAPEGAAPSPPLPAPPRDMPQLRILLAEDNSTNRLVLTHRLQQMGHRADTVSDGQAAVAAVRARPYDLVIMDMMMPGMDGLEATRAIRALPGPESRLPIIGLTAAAMPEDEAACLAAGMDGYERKPIGTERLRAAILAAAALREPVRA